MHDSTADHRHRNFYRIIKEHDVGVFANHDLAFAIVHANCWLTAIGWGVMVGALLVYTKSLGACIIAHAVTNGLLAVYVLRTHEWALW